MNHWAQKAKFEALKKLRAEKKQNEIGRRQQGMTAMIDLIRSNRERKPEDSISPDGGMETVSGGLAESTGAQVRVVRTEKDSPTD